MALIAIDFGYWPQEQDRSGGGAGSAACFGQVLGRHQLVRRANRGALFTLGKRYLIRFWPLSFLPPRPVKPAGWVRRYRVLSLACALVYES